MSLWGMMATLLLFLPHISLGDPNEIGVSFCCPPGSVYQMKASESLLLGRSSRSASCVPVGDGDGPETLEGQEVMAVATMDGRKRALRIRNTGTQNTTCNYGALSMNFFFDSTGLGEFKPMYDIKLEGGQTENEGNVIFKEKPICDDSWGTAAATVACRMLGYEHGDPRMRSYFPNKRGADYIIDDIQCEGVEESLTDCSYTDQHDCSEEEAAGVSCSSFIGQSNTSLTVDGALATHAEPFRGKRLEPGTFCLERKSEVQAKAFHCPPQSKLIPLLSARLWDFLTGTAVSGPDSIQGKLLARYPDCPDCWEGRNLIKMLDKDGSVTVTTEEFNQFITENLKDIYNLLDQDSNGALEANTEGKILENIPFKLIDATLVKAFSFLDFTGDSSFSYTGDICLMTEDTGCRSVDRDRNGIITFEEKGHSSPVTWPAPFYKLYTLLDVDQNEDFSLVEVRNFVERTFTVIDTNNDCKISIDEICNLVKNIGLPKITGLSLRLLLKQYTSILSYFFTELIMKGDKNLDGKTTFDEVTAIDDLDWADSLALTVATVGYPNMDILYGVMGHESFRDREQQQENRVAHIERMMNGLATLLDNPTYSRDVKGLCSNFIPGIDY